MFSLGEACGQFRMSRTDISEHKKNPAKETMVSTNLIFSPVMLQSKVLTYTKFYLDSIDNALSVNQNVSVTDGHSGQPCVLGRDGHCSNSLKVSRKPGKDFYFLI